MGQHEDALTGVTGQGVLRFGAGQGQPCQAYPAKASSISGWLTWFA